MDRRLFLGGIIGGVVSSLLNKNFSGERTKMPAVFVGHGSPMNAIQKNPFTDFLSHLPEDLPRPSAILVVSAHWETRGTKVLKSHRPKTIHDFGGFPEPLYQIQYPAPGSLTLAERISHLSQKYSIETDASWGLDHGAWTVLKFMYPEASIPVLQLSLNQNMTLAQHLEFARELKPLRDEGVLILGSGNITHNLRRVVWDESAPPLAWTLEFDEMIKKALIEKNDSLLLNQEARLKELWSIAHPSLEHYLPLLYVYGAAEKNEDVRFVHESIQLGSLSMRSLVFGA